MTRELCFQFAYQLYVNSEDGGGELKNLWSVGEEIGIDRPTVQQIAEHLKNEGLLEYLSFAGDASSDVLIGKLRNRFEDSVEVRIKTIRSVGYMLVADVKQC